MVDNKHIANENPRCECRSAGAKFDCLTNGEKINKTTMRILPGGFNTAALQKECKNKWRWAWMSENDRNGEKWIQWLQKPDVAGSD